MLIDTHCHIHDPEFFKTPEEREEIYLQASEKLDAILLVGTSERDSELAVEFADKYPKAFAIVGVHPHDSKNGWSKIRELAPKAVGIGEIGLDYFYNNSPKDIQHRALEEQLQVASDFQLPVSFHVREAFDDFWPIFDNFSNIKGVLHSFTDTAETLGKALSKGLFIGVNGISTFTRDESQREMFNNIPLSRMLLETDAPFLTPKPFRGKINKPELVEYVAKFHADCRSVDVNEIIQQTSQNAKSLFNLNKE